MSDERAQPHVAGQPDFPFKDPTTENPAPFIPNETSYVDEGIFKKDDIINFYVDGARFLPENVTYSRIILKVLT